MKKLKILFNREEPSSESIKQLQDFSSVLRQAKIGRRNKHWQRYGWWGGSMALLLLFSAWLYWQSQTSKHHTVELEAQSVPTPELLPYSILDTIEKSEAQRSTQETPEQELTISKKSVGRTSMQPIKKLPSPDYESFLLLNNRSNTVKTSRGSLVYVPAMAFVKAGKNPIPNEPITLRIREYHDALDIALSDIPMAYDSANIHGHLQSAGMIECWAIQGKDTLQLAPNKSLQVSLRSSTIDPSYNLYKLDKNRQWKYLGKDNTNKSNQIMEVPPSKFVSEDLLFNRHLQPIRPKVANPKNFRFTLDLDSLEFPHLYILNTISFEVDSTQSKFKSNYYSVESTNIEVANAANGYSFKFFHNNRFIRSPIQVVAYPTYDSNDSVRVWATFNKLKEELQKTIEKQEETRRLNELVSKKNQELYRSFPIAKMGIYNCDRLLNQAKAKSMTPSYPSIEKVLTVKLVDLTANTVIEYSGQQPILYLPGNRQLLLLLSDKGIWHYVSIPEFSKIKKSEPVPTLRAQQLPPFTRGKDLKVYLENLN